jgi:hypothetical protein
VRWKSKGGCDVTGCVSRLPIGVSRLEPRGIDLRRGNGPGKDGFNEQATGEFTEFERIEPEEPQCVEQQGHRFTEQAQDSQRIESQDFVGVVAQRQLRLSQPQLQFAQLRDERAEVVEPR